MTPAELYRLLVDTFGEAAIPRLVETTRDPWIQVTAAEWRRVAQFLRDDPRVACETLNDLCAVDYFETDPRKKTPTEPRIEVVYRPSSYRHRHQFTLKVVLPRWQQSAGELPSVDSVAAIWSIAEWHEREAFDLMGVEFLGHPRLTRILCPEDWVGHPLRKDYEFPLEYHGIRGR